MEQINLNLAPQFSLEHFVGLLVQKSLNRPDLVLQYETAEEIKAFKEAVKTISGNAYSKGYDSMLEFTVNAFYDKLSHEEWANFYYQQYISGSKTLNENAHQVVAKYEDAFPLDEWRKKIFDYFDLLPAQTSYSFDKKSYYLETSDHKALPEDLQLKTTEFLNTKFHEFVINDWEEHSTTFKMKVIKFLIRDYEKNNAFNFLPPKEINKLITSLAPSISRAVYDEPITYSNKDYTERQKLKSDMDYLYSTLFTTKLFTIEEKNHILYDLVGLDKNHFYKDSSRVKQVIRDGTLEDIKYMFDTITFPISNVSAHSVIMQICDAERVQVGRGIRLASWFLELCEKDFEKGKYVFEFFLPHIKFEMETDKKTTQIEGISFLVAYSQKKAKTSKTMIAMIENVHNAIINYEKDLLSRKLQLELPLQGELNLTSANSEVNTVRKKFKL